MPSSHSGRSAPRLTVALTGRLTIAVLLALPLSAQRPAAPRAAPAPIKLSAVLTTFLVDSGVRTRALPWSTGSGLPIRWETTRPVRNPDSYGFTRGLVRMRAGNFLGSIGDSVVLPIRLAVFGGDSGLVSVTLSIDSMLVATRDGGGFFLNREMIEAVLVNDGLVFKPLKCSRATEGASYGNLVDAIKAPGKTASGLWWSWEAPRQELRVALTILYRRADMNEVECYSG